MEVTTFMINNINNINSTPSFQARLDVKTAVKNGKRLANIQDLFAQKTSRYQQDTLHLVPPEDGLGSTQALLNKESLSTQFLTKDLNELMESLSDNDIAKKLVRLFKSLKEEARTDKVIDEIDKQIKRLESLHAGNSKKSVIFRKNGDFEMAQRYKTLAEQNLRKLEMVKAQKAEIRENSTHRLEQIAKGDPELEENFDICFKTEI